MFTGFNPYGMMQNPFQPTRPQLPQQQIVQVSGPDSLSQIQMAPNSSLLAMDQGAPTVYLVQTDGVGKVSWTAYDIAPHKDKAQIQQESMDARLAAVEAAIKRLEGRANESDAHGDAV